LATVAPSTVEFPGVGEPFRSGFSGNPNRFRVCKLANTFSAELTAESGTFYTTEWQARIGRDHGVDKDHSGIQFGREEFLFFAIVSPGARAEAKCRVVGEVDRFVSIA